MDDIQLSLERKRRLEQELARCLRVLIDTRNPERVIVFGSFASGQVHAWSDLDWVIVVPTEQPFLERARLIRRLLNPQVGMDFLVYTPEEFEQLCRERPFFRDEIVAKGVVAYERG
jgi:predicted nucleotidyltransferase